MLFDLHSLTHGIEKTTKTEGVRKIQESKIPHKFEVHKFVFNYRNNIIKINKQKT